MTSTKTRVENRRSLLTGDGGRILLFAILASGLTGPGQTIGVSVFIDHFISDLEITRSEVSGAYLVGTLSASLFLPSVGRFIDRHGVRKSQVVIGLAFALVLVNMSFVTGLITLAVGFIGIRLLGQGSLSLVSTVTVSLRFEKDRGTALGVFSTFSAALLALAPILLGFAISTWGWRSAWLAAAVAILVTVIPLAWFGLASMPRGTVAKPSKAPPITSRQDASINPTENAVTRADAVRTRGFWILVAISGSTSMLATGLNFHQIDLLTTAGLSTTAAAALFLPQVIGSSIAGFGFGVLVDRVDGPWLPAAAAALLVSAHLLAAIVAPGLVVFIYAIMLGAAGGASRTVTSALLPKWFGTQEIGSIQGTLTTTNVGLSAVGPVTLAVLESSTGSYATSVLILALIPVGAGLFAFSAPRGSKTGG